jgi:hypothetical protein
LGTLLLASLALVTVAGASPTPSLGRAVAALDARATGGEERLQVLVLRVYFRDHEERDRLANELGAAEIATTGGFLTVYADWARYTEMVRRGIRAEIDQELTEEANPDSPIPNPFYGGYRTTQEIEAFLDQKVAAYPALAEKIDIGDSWCKTHPGQCTQPNTWNGYDLWVLRITNRDIPGTKPVFWFDAGIHPNEIATPEVAMRYINWLLDGYNSNPDAHWLVDHHEIWVMPVLNPDGHHIVSSGGNSPYYQRKNADYDDGCSTFGQFGTDLNRNFTFMWGCCNGSSGHPCDQTYRGPSAGSEEETQAVMAKIRQVIPDQRGPGNNDPAPITTTGIYQSMHTAAVLNLYSWGWTSQPSPNNADISNIGAHMSAPNAGGNGYPSCQPPNCLYAVDGATLDWSYGELGIPGFTTELRGGMLPQYSCLDNPGCGSQQGIWPENRGMLIYQAKIARTPYLLTRGPDANVVTTTPLTVTQGTNSHLSSTINYDWTGNAYLQNVAAAEYYIDTPPWAGGTPFPMSPTDGSYNSPTEGVEAIVSTGSLSVGRHTLFVRGRGVNDYQGYQSWGPISAAFLYVLPGNTPTPITNTPTPAPPTSTATGVPPTATNTPVPPTPTTAPATPAPPTATNTSAVPTASSTQVPPTRTNTPALATNTPTATIAVAPCAIPFSDVQPSDYFYEPVKWLFCRGAISGYADGTFRPYNNTTRGQLTKIVVLAEGWPIDLAGAPHFRDVDSSNPFYDHIETAVNRGIITGYDDRTFRWGNNVTRGQLAKIIVLAEDWPLIDSQTPTFTDVPRDHTFYQHIETAFRHNAITGYEDRTFRPANNATRGQISAIVHRALTAP